MKLKSTIILAFFTLYGIKSNAQIWGESNTRTDTRHNAGLSGDAGAMSGFYQTSAPVNFPAGATSWWHLLDVRHSSPSNNYAMQFSGSFFDQNLFFRKTNNVPTQSWSRVLAETDGKVGIGTYAPTGKLNIGGAPDGISSIVLGDISTGNLNVPSGAVTGGYNIDFRTWRDVAPDQIGARIRGERINNFAPNNALKQSMELAFYTSDGLDQSQLLEKVRIKSDGSVGIGTADTKGYKLAVAGTVVAEAITVKLRAIWPDYVFNPDYALRPLSDLKAYIKDNHHLPEFPAAKEVGEKGLNLGEMNKLLTKKVEELTLYLIEKDEKEKSQQIQINQLKEQVAEILKKIK
jgi:hypothetical protein